LEHSNDWADCACFPAPAAGAEAEGAVAEGAGDAGAGVCAKAAPVNIAAANPNAITLLNVFIVLTFAILIALSLSSDRESSATTSPQGFLSDAAQSRECGALGKEICPSDAAAGLNRGVSLGSPCRRGWSTCDRGEAVAL
jgi:hypothetical protein